MPVRENTTTTSNIDVAVRETDFVSRFAQNWDALRDIMGIMRPIRKAPGTKLISYKAKVTLEDGNVPEGDEIPFSLAEVEEVAYQDITIQKYSKGVSIEAVAKYGADIAVEKTDDEFLNQLQLGVLARFYTFLNTGTLVDAASTFQSALAKARGLVIDKFNKMRKTVTEVVGFANVLDFYDYLGGADITTQTAFGLTYVQNFMGYRTLFLLSDPDIARGTVIAVPTENIDLYYIDPNDSDFARLGLQYRVDGETNLIGFHVQGNYGRALGEMYALMGMTLWAEYLDGIAVVTIDDNTLTDLTVAADNPNATYPWTDKSPKDFQSNIAVANGGISGDLKFIEGGLSPSGPLSGDGHFLALKFSNFSSGLTYANVQVGLVPSAGTGMQTLDSDTNAVFKIADNNSQRLKVVQSDAAGHKNVQVFSLAGLTLESTGA